MRRRWRKMTNLSKVPRAKRISTLSSMITCLKQGKVNMHFKWIKRFSLVRCTEWLKYCGIWTRVKKRKKLTCFSNLTNHLLGHQKEPILYWSRVTKLSSSVVTRWSQSLQFSSPKLRLWSFHPVRSTLFSTCQNLTRHMRFGISKQMKRSENLNSKVVRMLTHSNGVMTLNSLLELPKRSSKMKMDKKKRKKRHILLCMSFLQWQCVKTTMVTRHRFM